jgi:hypothetical protein
MNQARLVWLAVLSASLTAGLSGCRAKPPVTDDALTTTVQNQISADTAIAGQPITVSVQNGVVTLDGVVANAAQKTLAARDVAGIEGVKEVYNNLAIGPASATSMTPPPAAPPLAPAPRPALERHEAHQAAPIERIPQDQVAQNNPPPSPAQPQPQQATPPPPPPPPQPVYKNVVVPAGETIPVRVTQTLDSATAQQGDPFSGVVSSDVVINGLLAIPAGTPVSGQVDVAKDATHFKGSSQLTVSLNSMTRRGDKVSLTTDGYTVQGKGRGANTAEKGGGGAVVGAILGGIFGGGKGAAIGAAAGGGVGAGSNAITRGQQVQIQSETIVRFRLTTDVTVRVRTDADEREHHENTNDPNLVRRPNN